MIFARYHAKLTVAGDPGGNVFCRKECSRMESTTAADLILELTISDPDLIAELEQYADGDEREQFALKAIKIGVMALRQARGQIDADAVRREGERLMNDLKNRLDGHERRHLHVGPRRLRRRPPPGVDRLVRHRRSRFAVVARPLGHQLIGRWCARAHARCR